MKVLYEGAIYQMLRQGGVARCFSELINHLPVECEPTLLGPEECRVELAHPNFRRLDVRTEPTISWLRKWTRESLQRNIIQLAQETEADLDHWTYYSGLCRRPLRKSGRPLVITVLDFVHEAYPDLDPSGKHSALKRNAIEIADQLICISHSTQAELQRRYPKHAAKATVIPLGTSLQDVTPAAAPPETLNRPYVLFVGRRNSYKNFALVWHAWHRVRHALPKEARLVVAGPPVKRRERSELGWTDQSQVISLPGVTDSVLRTLYQNASAFVFPSRAEGFGLPSLEAMACGTPVLVSDLPVMREVVGDSGYYFGIDEVSHLGNLFEASIAGQLPNASSIIERGLARAGRFTWSETAKRTAEVYRRVLERNETKADHQLTSSPA
ncbi:MAG: glycosyltransferase family 1 protein [Planctomycetota bacterium]